MTLRYEILSVTPFRQNCTLIWDDENSEAVLTDVGGDVLFYETIGRTDFPRGNHADLINNIRNKLFALPETVQVVAGHGRMTSIGHEKRHNPFF